MVCHGAQRTLDGGGVPAPFATHWKLLPLPTGWVPVGQIQAPPACVPPTQVAVAPPEVGGFGLPDGVPRTGGLTGGAIGQKPIEPPGKIGTHYPAHQQRLAQGRREEFIAARLPRLTSSVTTEPIARAALNQVC